MDTNKQDLVITWLYLPSTCSDYTDNSCHHPRKKKKKKKKRDRKKRVAYHIKAVSHCILQNSQQRSAVEQN